jgi:hypothetical protein
MSILYTPVNLKLINWLIDYLGFYVPLKNISLIWRHHIAGEGLHNLGLCSALRAFEQGGIFIVQHLLWHGTSVVPVSSEGPPHSVASYDTRGDVEDLFWPESSRGDLKLKVPKIRLLLYTWIDWVIDCLLFYVPLKNFSLMWRRHHCQWRAIKISLCFEQGGIFIVSHLLWHRTSVFPVSSEGPLQSLAISRLLRHAWGCKGPNLTPIFTGSLYLDVLLKINAGIKLATRFYNLTNGMISILTLSTSHTYVATFHYHLHMAYIFLNLFDMQGPALDTINFWVGVDY